MPGARRNSGLVDNELKSEWTSFEGREVNFFVVLNFSSLGDFVSSLFSHLLLMLAMHSGKMFMAPS